MPRETVIVRMACHLGVRHVADALGDVDDAEAEAFADRGERPLRRLEVEAHLTAREGIGVDAAEHEVGVGHGRFDAAAAVAGGAGGRACRAGPDAQAARLDPGDGAAAGADRVDVHHAHEHGLTLERRLGRDVGHAVDDERDVEGGAAHVDADEVVGREVLGELLAADRSAHRAREQRLQGSLARRLRGQHAARGLHDVQRHVDAAVGQLLLEVEQVVTHDRAGVGLDHGGRGALVLAPLLRRLVREGDREVLAELLAEDLARAQLVLGVLVAEEERDGDRAVAAVLGALRRGAHRALVEGGQLAAVVLQAPGDADDVLALDERLRLAVLRVVQLEAGAAGDVVAVLHAVGGEQQHVDAASLEEGVQPLGRPVDDEVDLGEVVDERSETLDHAPAEFARSRRGLGRAERLPGLVVGHNVGERATDVHRHPVLAQELPPLASFG